MKINRRQLYLILIDAVLVAIALFFAILLRFDFDVQPIYLQRYQQLLFAVLIIRLSTFYAFGLYRSIWQYASIDELNAVVYAVTLSSIFIYGYSHFVGAVLPRSVYIISWILNIGLIGGVRFALRLLRRAYQGRAHALASRVLIVGAGYAGNIVVQELQRHEPLINKVAVGFIDDAPDKQFCAIHGIKILGGSDAIPQVVEKHRVNEIVIAMPSASKETIARITRICSKLPSKVNILPGVYELLSGDVSISKIRPVQIEDLLGREEVRLNLDEIAGYLSGETVLVTGAGGSIGSELCRQIARFNPAKLLLLDQTENNVYDIEMEMQKRFPHCKLVPIVADVRDEKRIGAIFSTHNPAVIFHAAAHKHVPLMECNREEAMVNNILGTRNVAEAADRFGAKSFLLISTDKAVNPTSVMGATKRMAEITIQTMAKKSKTRFCAVRFGNVLESRGSVIPLFKKQIAEGGPVTVTHQDMTRYFMTIPEAVQLVIQAGSIGKNGEILVLDMGDPVKITDLAHDLIRLSGFEPDKDIKIVYTGIRPGEKLFEEVLTGEEGIKVTKHERIFIAGASDQNGVSFGKEIAHLNRILRLGNESPFAFPLQQSKIS